MNIYDWAKANDADYYDMRTGYIYRVSAYNNAVRLGLPTKGIEVFDTGRGKIIGIAKRET